MSESVHRDLPARFVRRSVAAVRDEYEAAGGLPESYQRAKWGSAAGMRNAFLLGLSVLPWSQCSSWIDVGCGEADFFVAAENAGHLFERLVGCDLSPSMLAHARRKSIRSPVEFYLTSFHRLPPAARGPFDVVTAIGVLQQCGMTPEEAVAALARHTAPGKFLFLTTKNAGWARFAEPGFLPEKNHSWFQPDRVMTAVETAGFDVLKIAGFIPAENEVVALEDSHTLFVLAQRNADDDARPPLGGAGP